MGGGEGDIVPARVSVVIPAFRAAGYIGGALQSVFAQTFTDFEVVVVNDGSPDEAALEAVLGEFCSRVVYLKQPNLGAGAARNAAILRSTAPLVAFLDADDRWHPDFLRQQLALLSEGSGADVVYADAELVGDGPLAGRRYMDVAPSSGEVTLETLLLQQCNVITSAVVASRAAIVAVGLFDERLRRGQDYDLWLRLAHAGYRFAYHRAPLVVRELHKDSLSGTSTDELERVLRVLDKASQLSLSPRERLAVSRRITTLNGLLAVERSKQLLVSGQHAAAREQLRIAATLKAGWKLRLALILAEHAPRMLRHLYRIGSPAGYAQAVADASLRTGSPTVRPAGPEPNAPV